MNYTGTAHPGLVTDRWDVLFADLECQLAAEHQVVLGNEIAELTRAEAASVGLAERLLGAIGQQATLYLTAIPGSLCGVVRESTNSWVLLAEASALRECIGTVASREHPGVTALREHIVPLSAITAFVLPALPPRTALTRLDQLSLGMPLRRWQRDRSAVVVHTASREFQGRLRTVGADYLELACGELPDLHNHLSRAAKRPDASAPDALNRDTSNHRVIVPFTQIARVSRCV